MAWWNKGVSLGNFPDLAGAVNKLQESVKNIEKNFDSALGFEAEEKSHSSNEASGSRTSSANKRTLFDPVMALMGHKSEESTAELAQKPESSEQWLEVAQSLGKHDFPEQSSGKHDFPEQSSAVDGKEEEVQTGSSSYIAAEQTAAVEGNEFLSVEQTNEPPDVAEKENAESSYPGKVEFVSPSIPVQSPEPTAEHDESSDSTNNTEKKEISEVGSSGNSEPAQVNSDATEVDQVGGSRDRLVDSHKSDNLHEDSNEQKMQEEFTHEQKLQEEVIHKRMIQEEVTLERKMPEEMTHEQKMPEEMTHEQKMQEDVTHEEKTQEVIDEKKIQAEEMLETVSSVQTQELIDSNAGAAIMPTGLSSSTTEETDNPEESVKNYSASVLPFIDASEVIPESVSKENDGIKIVEAGEDVHDTEIDIRYQHQSSRNNISDTSDAALEMEKVKLEMKMMETALQGAARQAQAKADEIAKLMNENEQLKEMIGDLKRKSSDAEIESLREEYHQRVARLERKVYALTKERDTLRREHSKKSDAAALLKEKDEIIEQVMAEGEELSKKQAAQEAQIRKLRAQIRELEEEKKGVTAKLQVEENKVESIKKDKLATEKLLQETIEKHQAELGAQKEYYTSALSASKEAEAIAEARANNEAQSELESRLREAEERESILVQALEELRQTLTRKEQQAVFREDMFRRDIEDLQKRYQASERRCEEFITQVPESTRPLLRQIEAMQETTSRRAEAWAAVERSLNSRLQEAEAKAASAEERERSMNERLSQTLSRINVLEAQISCLRAEQTQLTKSLEKERQRAAENRQEYLAAKEEADTQEGRANQLEVEIRELRRKHKQELQDTLMQRELLQQEIEKEKSARLDLERTARVNSAVASNQTPIARQNSAFENGNLTRKLSSASSLGSMEESYFLQASLDSSDNLSERRNFVEATMSPYYMKSMTPSAFEAALRQKEGELASYMSRLSSMESIRDSLAEELVKMTEQCEKLRVEAAMLPGIRAELEALRRRHSAALELMGERDEELEELRADIIDMKDMYREQVNLLVNKIQILSSSIGNSEVESEI